MPSIQLVAAPQLLERSRDPDLQPALRVAPADRIASPGRAPRAARAGEDTLVSAVVAVARLAGPGPSLDSAGEQSSEIGAADGQGEFPAGRLDLQRSLIDIGVQVFEVIGLEAARQ